MPCSICQHPKRQEIDQAFIAGSATLTALSQAHSLSTSALHRHKQHLLKKIAAAQNRFQEILREGYLFILYEFLTMIHRAARTAEAEGNERLFLQAVRQGTNIMKFMAKLDSSLSPDTVHRLLASPQWAEQGSLLPTDPQFVDRSPQALADSLFPPCPEPSDQDQPLAAGPMAEAVLAELAGLNPEQLQDLLAGLSQSRGICNHDQVPAKREKGGKKPGKTTSMEKYSMNFQTVSGSEKSTEKNSNLSFTQNSGLSTQNLSDLPGYSCCFIDDDEQTRMDELDKKISQLDRELTRDLTRAEEEAIYDHLYDCGPIPAGKSISAYLHEQGLLNIRDKKNGQGRSTPRS
jgi:hypothetical protein